MNRKGFIGDIPTILVGGVVVTIVTVIAILLITTVNDAFQADSNIPAEGKYVTQSGADRLPSAFDIILILMFLGLPLVAGTLAYYLDATGIFFWLTILLTIIFVIVAGVLGYVWEMVLSNDVLNNAAADLYMAKYILAHYGIYALYVSTCVLGGLFFKTRTTI